MAFVPNMIVDAAPSPHGQVQRQETLYPSRSSLLFGVMTTEAYKYVALFLEILTQQRTDFLEKGREGKRGGVVNFLTHC